MTLRANSSFSGARMARIIAESGNEQRLESNEFAIIAGNATLNIQTTRQRIVLGQPVKWIANVTISDGSPVTLQLPAGAENVSVTALDATGSPLVDENVILTSPITGQVIARESDGNSFLAGLLGKLQAKLILVRCLTQEMPLLEHLLFQQPNLYLTSRPRITLLNTIQSLLRLLKFREATARHSCLMRLKI